MDGYAPLRAKDFKSLAEDSPSCGFLCCFSFLWLQCKGAHGVDVCLGTWGFRAHHTEGDTVSSNFIF